MPPPKVEDNGFFEHKVDFIAEMNESENNSWDEGDSYLDEYGDEFGFEDYYDEEMDKIEPTESRFNDPPKSQSEEDDDGKIYDINGNEVIIEEPRILIES